MLICLVVFACKEPSHQEQTEKKNDKSPKEFMSLGLTRDPLHRKEAIEDYTNAIKADPNCAAAYSLRAHERKEMGLLKDALDDYSMAIKIDSNYGSCYFWRGVLKCEMGDTASACDDFRKSHELGQSGSELITKYCSNN